MIQTKLPFLPERTPKPRKSGITMVMDKGLSVRQAEDLVETGGDYIDFVKLGFGTSLVTNNLSKKIKVYRNAGIRVYLGGTLFEAFIVRGKLDDYCRYIDKLKLDTVEISDGSIILDHDQKCKYIRKLARDYMVLSEVGSKESGIFISPQEWIDMMTTELQAGAFKVIGESRESGSVGIYRPSGKAHVTLIHKILSHIDIENIIWEAPLKSQQTWFIKEFGSNVNLGNIPPLEVLPLETLRLGLRVDTFFQFLPGKFDKFRPK